MRDVFVVLSDLSDAFSARDLDAALACFDDAADVMFAASADDDYAVGPQAVADTLRAVFARDETYDWCVRDVEVADGDAFRIVLADITTFAQRDATVESWPLQLSGVLRSDDGALRWRNLRGVLPVASDVEERFRDARRSRAIPPRATQQLRA